jgi:hypothetical protein
MSRNIIRINSDIKPESGLLCHSGKVYYGKEEVALEEEPSVYLQQWPSMKLMKVNRDCNYFMIPFTELLTETALPFEEVEKMCEYLGWSSEDVLSHMVNVGQLNMYEKMKKIESSFPENCTIVELFTLKNSICTQSEEEKAVSDKEKIYKRNLATRVAIFTIGSPLTPVVDESTIKNSAEQTEEGIEHERSEKESAKGLNPLGVEE